MNNDGQWVLFIRPKPERLGFSLNSVDSPSPYLDSSSPVANPRPSLRSYSASLGSNSPSPLLNHPKNKILIIPEIPGCYIIQVIFSSCSLLCWCVYGFRVYWTLLWLDWVFRWSPMRLEPDIGTLGSPECPMPEHFGNQWRFWIGILMP